MNNKAYEYATAIVKKKIVAPKYVIKQCKQFLKIAEDKDKKYVINNRKVNQIEAILKILIMPKTIQMKRRMSYDKIKTYYREPYS